MAVSNVEWVEVRLFKFDIAFFSYEIFDHDECSSSARRVHLNWMTDVVDSNPQLRNHYRCINVYLSRRSFPEPVPYPKSLQSSFPRPRLTTGTVSS